MSPRNSTAPDGRGRDEVGMNQGRSNSYHQHDVSMQPGSNTNMRTGQLSPRPLPPNVRFYRLVRFKVILKLFFVVSRCQGRAISRW